MKLWQKTHTETAEQVERFTVGRDKEFDLLLAPFDIEGSRAHARMLCEVGIISEEENIAIQNGLNAIGQMTAKDGFVLPEDVEDIHSYVELELTKMIGDTGKKMHTARSRNDQVAVDIKLYLRNAIKETVLLVNELFDLLLQKSDQHKDKLIPGYTHFQIAMPSSAGLWLSAYAESLTDDLEFWEAAYNICNKNPLGSGAGFGSSFAIDRKKTTEYLGFADLNWNSVYAQMTRGKAEKSVATAISYLAATLSRLAYDCTLYMNQNFGFISFPESLTTGSSIMPHKKNPDVLELIRAKCNRLQATPNELTLLTNNLPSGYHRDFQLTKEIIFPALNDLHDCMEMTMLMLAEIEVKEALLDDPKYKYLFTVEAMNALVQKGFAYRDAYRQIGDQVNEGTFNYSPEELKHVHEGSIGNLCLDEIKNAFTAKLEKIIKH